jgi:hypothetical protein
MHETPSKLQESCLKNDEYPQNLIPRDVFGYKSKLASYKKRLQEVEDDLCLIFPHEFGDTAERKPFTPGFLDSEHLVDATGDTGANLWRTSVEGYNKRLWRCAKHQTRMCMSTLLTNTVLSMRKTLATS